MEQLITEYEIQLAEPSCAPGSGRYSLEINVAQDISPVFPYLNAVFDNAWYDHENEILILREPNQAYALRPHEIKVARMEEPVQAQQIASEVVNKFNQVWQERHKITPRFTERKKPSVIQIYQFLPKTNCRLCGYLTCLAYAAALHGSSTQLEKCPFLSKPENTENRQKIAELLSLN